MDDPIDLIANQISECISKIEAYRRAIRQLRQKIRELSWQVIETDEGEVAHYDDSFK